jgi:hypothetical protein
MISRTIFCSAQVPTVPGNECPSFARSAPIPIKRRSGQLSLPAAQTARSCYPFFGRPRFFGGGSATTFRPKPLAKASLDRAAAYSGATIGYDGGRPHLIRYCSGVV